MAFLKRKKLKFNVDLQAVHLSDVPLVNAVLFAKVRLLDGGAFSEVTESVEVQSHSASWTKRFLFFCRIASDPCTGVLERCPCRISIRKEQKGGKSYQKLGFVDVNLSEFAASGVEGITQSFLLDGYGAHQRQDNSRLLVKITMSHQCADPVFKVPRIESKMEEELLNPAERKAQSHASHHELSNFADKKLLSGGQKVHGAAPNESDSCKSSSPEADFQEDSSSAQGMPTGEVVIRNDGNLPSNFSANVPSTSLQGLECSRRSAVAPSGEARRLSQDRSQLGNGNDIGTSGTRIRATRIDAEDIIDKMLAETDIANADHPKRLSDQGLALFVSKDGEAVVRSNSQLEADSFECVIINNASTASPI